jgi:plastocyanin
MMRKTAFSAAALLCASAIAATAAAETFVVTQKGRMFEPSAVEISAGATIRFVNDDAPLLHHAYLEAIAFAFDIGEQEAGESSEIVFPVPGVFDVFCGIHPKMKLQVTVR